MQVTHLTAERREEWNALVAQEPSFGLLQSWEWGDFKETLGWKPYRIGVEQHGRLVAGAQVLIKMFPLNLFSVAYVPRGPIGNWLSDGTTAKLLSGLHQISRQHRAVFLKIEPALLFEPAICQTLQNHHFRASPFTNQPRATIVVDLTPDLDNILKHLHKICRYSIRYATRKGVTVRCGNSGDLSTFYELMQITGQRAGFAPRSFGYYQNQWNIFAPLGLMRLFMACYQGKVLAVHIGAIFGSHAAYLHGASSGEHANLKSNYLLIWEAIRWAKAHGCTTLDLWGIPDEVGLAVHEGKEVSTKGTDGLWGVYEFKRKFSENILLYVPGFEYTYAPFFHSLAGSKFLKADKLDRIAVWMGSLKESRHTQRR